MPCMCLNTKECQDMAITKVLVTGDGYQHVALYKKLFYTSQEVVNGKRHTAKHLVSIVTSQNGEKKYIGKRYWTIKKVLLERQ